MPQRRHAARARGYFEPSFSSRLSEAQDSDQQTSQFQYRGGSRGDRGVYRGGRGYSGDTSFSGGRGDRGTTYRGRGQPQSVSEHIYDATRQPYTPDFRPQSQAVSRSSDMKILCNFFAVPIEKRQDFIVYSVKFEPDLPYENRKLRQTLIRSIEAEITQKIGPFVMSGINIYANTRAKDVISLRIQKGDDQYIAILQASDKVLSAESSQDELALNIIVKKMLRAVNLQQLTRLPKFFDMERTVSIPHRGLTIFRGYAVKAGIYGGSVLIYADFASKIIRDQSILNIIEEVQSANPRNFQGTLEADLIGQTVMANYGNSRCYRISKIDFDQTPRSTFFHNGTSISYAQYYERQYNIRVTDLNQPMLEHYDKNRGQSIYLIPELCRPTGITDDMRRDYQCMNDIAKFTRLQPHERLRICSDLITRLHTHQAKSTSRGPQVSAKELMLTYNLEFSQSPMELNYRLLQVPEVYLKNGPISIFDNGSFNIRQPLLDARPIHTWAILVTERDQQRSNDLARNLDKKFQFYGVELRKPKIQVYRNGRDLPYEIERLCSEAQDLQIILIVLPPSFRTDYSKVKHQCTSRTGVPTQVIMANNLGSKRYESICEKLALQMAAKTGSSLWCMKPPPGLSKLTMVIGIDVYHDVKNDAKSVLGMVATIHPNFSRYFSTAQFQRLGGEEIGHKIQQAFEDALRAYFEASGRRFMPDNIIIFRDGVGETQFGAVKAYEVGALRQAFLKFGGGAYNPQFAYVVVTKLTSAKFFSQQGTNISNPPMGLLIDTPPLVAFPDFYLISHAVTQGIAKPTLYKCVERQVNGNEVVYFDALKQLAFSSCFAYFNWVGAIKSPAPTMLAHKIAYMIGQNVKDTIQPNIRSLPFYL